jgi:hypothetical protein
MSLTPRFSKLDELSVPDHYWLGPGDRCYWLREYTSRAGYQHGETNQLIFNLKMEMQHRSNPLRWRHKEWAVAQVISEMMQAMPKGELAESTFVPIPPSKSRSHPEHDDRVLRIVRGLCANGGDCRELLVQNGDRDAAHSSESRRNPVSLAAQWSIDEGLAAPTPTRLIVVDDVLTTGASFVAARNVLRARFPDVEVRGVFVARRRFPDPDFGPLPEGVTP